MTTAALDPETPPAATALPPIIQGGMGVGVSDWRLAQAVCQAGQLGVVSGTAIDTVVVRRLQDGDPGGHVRRAMAHFPIPGVAAEVERRYFRPEGRPAGTPYALLPMYKQSVRDARQQITVLSAFVEVWLAREGHDRPVGMNLLTKVQMPNLALLYGAMLAGVGVVLMGAGIPREIPAALDRLAAHEEASIRLDVEGPAAAEPEMISFDPAAVWGARPAEPLQRPLFLAIVASNSLATMLARKASGRVDGFIVEGPTAGGHNAPPRGAPTFNADGEPLYGPRDAVDLDALAALGLPFWLAGGAGRPDRLRDALDAGAAGIQVGTLFAYCDESGFTPEIKRSVLGHVAAGTLRVRTDARASPTGYPFKLVQLAAAEGPAPRERICDLGGLRVAYRTPEGGVGYRCPAEPVDAYVRKGGAVEETEGRQCLCNALSAAIGQAQTRGEGAEPALITSGDDLQAMGPFLEGRTRYAAADVVRWLLSGAA